MSKILFPLSTNIKSLQRWGDYDISKRLKQSFILYDEVIIETGCYNFQGSEKCVLQGYDPWNEKNTKEAVIAKIENITNSQEDRYITHSRRLDEEQTVVIDKYKVEKQNHFIADYRTVDIISEIASGNYGKECDFFKCADVFRNRNHSSAMNNLAMKDLADTKFAEEVRKIHGNMQTIAFLNNLNDSLALSHLFDMPITVDSIYGSILRLKMKCQSNYNFTTLEKLATIGFPDFSNLSLERLLELRKDKAITSYRQFISDLSLKLKIEPNFDLNSFLVDELLKGIRELAPNKKEIFLNSCIGVLSNIPLPAIGAITTIGQAGKEIKEYRDFSSNWQSFILKAKE